MKNGEQSNLHSPLSHLHVLYRDILVDVLTAPNSIEEHVSHTEEIDKIAWHVADTVGKEILEHGEHTATNNHHHENA